MDMNNQVTYLVRTFNQEKYIEQCITSILKDSYDNKRILVVDDASTDNTLKILNKFRNDPQINIISNPLNLGIQGLVANFLNVLRSIQSEYICMIDGDDVILGDRARLQIELLKKSGKMGVYSNFHKINDQGIPIEYNAFNKKYPLYISNPYCFSTLLIRTQFLKEIQLLDQYGRAFDYVIALELYRTNNLTFLNKPLTGYRVSTNNLSLDKHKQLKAQYLMFKSYSKMNAEFNIRLGKFVSYLRYRYFNQ